MSGARIIDGGAGPAEPVVTAMHGVGWQLPPSSPDPRATGGIMRALPGDRLLVKERRAGEGDREALIIEVWSKHGRPPYVVRWHDGSQNVFFPASADTLIAGGLSH